MKNTMLVLILILMLSIFANAEPNGKMGYMHRFGYCQNHSEYGQRISIKTEKQAINYVKDFYKERGFPNIKIIRIKERPYFFKMHIIDENNNLNNKIILNKFDGRIRFLNCNKMSKTCPNN